MRREGFIAVASTIGGAGVMGILAAFAALCAPLFGIGFAEAAAWLFAVMLFNEICDGLQKMIRATIDSDPSDL